MFTKPDRVQLDTKDRLADQAIQEPFDEPRGGSDEVGGQADERVGGLGEPGRGFTRSEQDADTDAYEVVGAG